MIAYIFTWTHTEDIFPHYAALVPVAHAIVEWMPWSHHTPEEVDSVYLLLGAFVTVAPVTIAGQLLWRFRRHGLALFRRVGRM